MARNRFIFSLVMASGAALAAGGCDTTGNAGGAPGATPGKADGVGGAATFFIYDNGTRCLASPCPSLTAVPPSGEPFEVADLQLPESVSEDAVDDLPVGIRVAGAVEEGSWERGDAGTVVHVQEVYGEAPEFVAFETGKQCLSAPCASITAIRGDGHTEPVAGVDLAPLRLPMHEQLAVAENVAVGRVAVRGHVFRGGEAGPMLLVTEIAGSVAPVSVEASGKVCVTAPCPRFTVTRAGGERVEVAEVDLTMIAPSGAEEDEILADFESGAEAQGWVARGEWGPGAAGNRLIVTALAPY